MKALVCLISLLIIAGCQQSSESGYTTTGQNVGTGTLQDVHKDDAKFLLPRTFATSLHKARWMSSKQHYQEAVEASHEEVSYSVSFVYVPSGGFARQTSTASYQGLFKGLKKIDPEIDSSNLIPEFVGDVRAADLMVGNKTCITFVRVLGKVISGAFGVDGPAYASGVACGGADMSFGQVRAKAIPQIASFKFRERSPGSGTVVETKASPTQVSQLPKQPETKVVSKSIDDPKSPPSPGRMAPIAVEWEGYRSLIAGTIDYAVTEGRGKLTALLPGGEGECTGSYQLNKQQIGTWAIACSNGLNASGTMKAFGGNKGAEGEGTDIKGRKVRFTVGPAVGTSVR